MRNQPAATATRHLVNSRAVFLRLVDRVRSFPEGLEQGCRDRRDYEELEMAVPVHLLG